MIRFVAWSGIGVVILSGLAFWGGFQIEAEAIEPDHVPGMLVQRTTLYDGLPPALQFYLQQTVGRAPWVTRSAVIWGTGSIRHTLGPFTLWVPVRWHEAIDIDRGYVWRAEVLWWGKPVLHIEDKRVDGDGFFQFGNNVLSGSCISAAQEMRFAAERVWLPSTLIADNRVSWRQEGAWRLRMNYTGGAGDTQLNASFDWRTRALDSLSGTACGEGYTAVRWKVDLREWDNLSGIVVPVSGAVSRDNVEVYRFRVAGMAHNAPVDGFMETEHRDGGSIRE